MKFILFLLLFSITALAQIPSYQYQLDGTFPATLPGNLSTRDVRFTLLWNETNQTVKGVYQDDFFTNGSPVSGTASVQGRVFNVKLSRIMQGVSNIGITSSISSMTGGTMPMMVFMRDQTSATLNQANVSALATIRADYVEPNVSACDVGFGSLSGYCGIYGGSISEVSDGGNMCSLPEYGFKMELSADAKTNFYFYYSESVIVPSQTLGSFSSAPTSNVINIPNRHCGALIGTTFPQESCQTLNLTGTYSEIGEGRTFQGRYTISNEETGMSCAYDLNLNREKTF